jgi:hypothetical protein
MEIYSGFWGAPLSRIASQACLVKFAQIVIPALPALQTRRSARRLASLDSLRSVAQAARGREQHRVLRVLFDAFRSLVNDWIETYCTDARLSSIIWFVMSAMTKNSAAQELGRRRWSGVSAEARSIHAKLAVNAREEKRSRERANARARIPENIETLLADAARDDEYERSAYYVCGYRLGVAQLDQSSRNRVIRVLQRERREQFYQLNKWQREALVAMRAELHKEPVERLALDRAKLIGWNGRRASTSLRAIFKDPAIAVAIPRPRHYLFLAGLRAGAAGEAMRYHQPRVRF